MLLWGSKQEYSGNRAFYTPKVASLMSSLRPSKKGLASAVRLEELLWRARQAKHSEDCVSYELFEAFEEGTKQ